ncbi:MAG: GNAT family N-acetyltransferase [Bacteroidota bacterium]
MTSAITIRPCTISDIGTILALGIKTFRDTFAEYNTAENMRQYLEKTFTPGQLAKEFNETGSAFFLALDGELQVGYAKVRTSEKPEGLGSISALEIERIYAVQEYIGRGVGQTLMETCISHAKQLGCDTIWLGVWEYNPRAIAFYEKWGFEKFGEHVFMVGNDPQTDFLLKKKLN